MCLPTMGCTRKIRKALAKVETEKRMAPAVVS
jgi:hypothetical protein